MSQDLGFEWGPFNREVGVGLGECIEGLTDVDWAGPQAPGKTLRTWEYGNGMARLLALEERHLNYGVFTCTERLRPQRQPWKGMCTHTFIQQHQFSLLKSFA